MWLQFDWGEGPDGGGPRHAAFCAWLAWSRFRVVIATWDRTLGTLLACIDATVCAGWAGRPPTCSPTTSAR